MPTSFPDKKYLRQFTEYEVAKANDRQDDLDRILTASGVMLNWVGDIMTDPGWQWERRRMMIDELTLTGTNPEWNKVLIDEAQRSPHKFRAMLTADPKLKKMFGQVDSSKRPIMVRRDEDKLKVFDGMHRVIGAILAGRQEIEAFIGTPPAKPQPSCEQHVVYDLMRAYHQKRTTDRPGLVAALHYLRYAYANVDELLRTRFNRDWVADDEIQAIITEARRD